MKKNKKNLPFRTWDEVLKESLKQHPEEILDYLRASIEENGDIPGAVVRAIRISSEALDISLEDLAKKAKLQPSTVYKALGKKGNPTIHTLNAILGALGLKLTVEKKVG